MFKKKMLRIFAVLTAVCLGVGQMWAAAAPGIGNELRRQKSTLASGAELEFIQSEAPAGKLNTYLLSGKLSDVEIVPWFGESVASKQTLSQMVTDALKKGYRVIGAINGDFFEWTGHTRGLIVQNGRLILSGSEKNFQDQHWRVLGIKKNGQIIQGEPRIDADLQINGKTVKSRNFNRPRTENGLFIYNSDYGKTTKESKTSIDVVLKVRSGDFKIGQLTTATVQRVIGQAQNTSIGSGEMVLSVAQNEANRSLIELLQQLKQGNQITFKPYFTDGAWTDVVQATGGPDYLIKDSAYLPGGLWMQYAESYPSSAIGFRPDGTAYFFQADGRGSGGSAGIHPKHVATYFQSLGCHHALMLDGGGSSELVIVENGKAVIKNKVSDGSERPVASALLMVERKKNTPSEPQSPSSSAGVSTPAQPTPPAKPDLNGGGTAHQNSTASSHNGSAGAVTPQTSVSSGNDSSADVIPPKEDTKVLPYPTNDLLKARYINQIVGLKKGYSISKKSSDGKLLYEWLFYGKLLSQKSEDINLCVIQDSTHKERIEQLTNGAFGTYLSFKQTKRFPGSVTLRYVTESFAQGDSVNVYGYDATKECMVEIATGCIVKDNMVTFSFDTPMDLLLTKQRLTVEKPGSSNETTNSSHNGSGAVVLWICLGVLLSGALITTGVLLYKKKRKK